MSRPLPRSTSEQLAERLQLSAILMQRKPKKQLRKAFADNKSQVAFGKIYKEFKPVAATRITIDTPEKRKMQF